MKLEITADQYLEVEKLSLGVFKPLTTFMDELDFLSCVDDMRLKNGDLFPIPIVFDLDKLTCDQAMKTGAIELYYESNHVADIKAESAYKVDKDQSCKKIFGTTDRRHPGVSYFLDTKEYFLSGDITLHKRPFFSFSKYELSPIAIKNEILSRGWKSIVGFQTRNIPHRAHEYLQKVALEHVDGILIQPIVGYKKRGDFTPEAVIHGYQALIRNFYPKKRVIFSVLSTIMRYAGPREALFHAIIRRNYGCTDFIIGRDHAGVSDYYEKYAAQNLAIKFQKELGIRIMSLKGPFYCKMCDGIVTEKTCPHQELSPAYCEEISGTNVRNALMNKEKIDSKFVRKSVIDALRLIKEPFVK